MEFKRYSVLQKALMTGNAAFGSKKFKSYITLQN